MKRMYLTLAATLLAAGALAPLSAQSFGNAITIGDGQLFVGEPTYDMRSGVVYVFSQDASGAWSQTQRLEPASGEAENRFGIRLATQDDVLLASATRADDGTGAIYIYRDRAGTWTESGRLEIDDRSPADSLGNLYAQRVRKDAADIVGFEDGRIDLHSQMKLRRVTSK